MLPIALRTLATRSATRSSRLLLKPRAPQATHLKRVAAVASFGTRANPLAPEDGELDEMDDDDLPTTSKPDTYHSLVQESEPQVMPKARGEHLPVNWAFYQSIVGQPVINTFHALASVGYDAPWEIFVKYCDATGTKWRTVIQAVDRATEDNIKARIKAASKGAEGLYLHDCWKVLMMKRKAEAGLAIGDDDLPLVKDFTGGTWKEWNLARWGPRGTGMGRPTGSTKQCVTTLLPPTPSDPESRWFTITRPKDTSSAPRVQIHRRVLAGADLQSFRANFWRVPWAEDESTKSVALVFDKAAQTLRLVDRQGQTVSEELDLEHLAGLASIQPIIQLAAQEGLLDQQKWEQLFIAHRWRTSGIDTLDLKTNLARSVSLISYPVRTSQRPNGETRLRIPVSPLYTPITSTGGAGEEKPETQLVAVCLYPTHVASAIRGDQRLGERISALLENAGPDAPPDIADISEGVLAVPYVSTVGASRAEGASRWVIDPLTPNADPAPPTVTPAYVDAPVEQGEGESSYEPVASDKASFSSAWPETLRFWSPLLGRDLAFATRKIGEANCAWTGEQVRVKYPVLWEWARLRGHWREGA